MPEPTTLFYDGACPVCRREANHYRHLVGPDAIALVDIAAPAFDASSHGLHPQKVQRVLHARLPDGQIVTGVDAFAAVWERVPRYRWLVPLTRLWGSRQAMQVGYALFAAVRPHLPGRKRCAGQAKGV